MKRKWAPLILFLVGAVACAAPATPTTSPTPVVTSPALPTSRLACTDNADFAGRRKQMVDETIAPRGISDTNTLRAMYTVLRHCFVPDDYLDQAYADHPLPIGYGQTISQPFMVAWMTQLLALKPGDKVLEIGTGSGYQAAVLAELGSVDVYSVEIIPELAASAAARLQALGYTRVHLQQGDGYYGWQEFAPYDAIVVTAAPDHLPAPLVAQLKVGGRLVIPIGPQGTAQTLWLFRRTAEGVTASSLGDVFFVPLTGHGVETAPPRF